MKLSELPLNPFDDNVVFEPREAETPVPGLNEKPLEILVRQFARVEAAARPVRRPGLVAQLVTSSEPGLGKSHIIGRLFKKLAGRATAIYLRPFQDPGSSWRSILLKTAQELNRPDEAYPLASLEHAVTQLDSLAFGVFAHLFALMIEHNRVSCDHAAARVEEFRSDPASAFGHGDPDHYLVAWMRDAFPTLLDPMLREIRDSALQLNMPATAWLQVLHSYAFGGGSEEHRQACLEWIKGEGPLPNSSAQETGTGTTEESAIWRNAAAFERLQDLLSLAGFYRPFLFCFDQTELYMGSAGTVVEFGSVVDRLVSFGANLMVVVTANLEPWEREIEKTIQDAIRDRFSNYIELVGLEEEQARMLVRQRLAGCNVDEAEIARFCNTQWFSTIFGESKSIGVRNFLRRCARRCSDLSESRVVAPEHTLEDYFRHYEHEIRSKPKRLVFEPDVLRWSVAAVAPGVFEGMEISRFEDRKQYYPISWKQGNFRLLLGFEDSSHFSRWSSILVEAERTVTAAREQQGDTRILFLRTPEQRRIPAETWTATTQKFAAARDYLTVLVIDPEELVTLYACYDLHVAVMEGNTPFERAEALAFIGSKLKPWWNRVLRCGTERTPESGGALGKPEAPAAPIQESPGLREQVCKALSKRLFLSIDQLVSLIEMPTSAQAVLAVCQTMPQVKIFSTSQATALKWQSAR